MAHVDCLFLEMHSLNLVRICCVPIEQHAIGCQADAREYEDTCGLGVPVLNSVGVERVMNRCESRF